MRQMLSCFTARPSHWQEKSACRTTWCHGGMMALMLALTLPACTTVNLEDAMQGGAVQKQDVQPSLTGPDQYPDLNVPLVPAAPQLTDADTQATSADLRARREQLSGSEAQTSADIEELRQIADSHGEETLRIIEGR